MSVSIGFNYLTFKEGHTLRNWQTEDFVSRDGIGLENNTIVLFVDIKNGECEDDWNEDEEYSDLGGDYDGGDGGDDDGDDGDDDGMAEAEVGCAAFWNCAIPLMEVTSSPPLHHRQPFVHHCLPPL